MQIWVILTKSQCSMYDTQVTVKACGVQFIKIYFYKENNVEDKI